MITKKEPQEVISIDEEYKIRLDQMKESHKNDSNYVLNVLEAKDIFILSIGLALKNKLKPKKSKDKAQMFRTSYLKEDIFSLKSLIFSFFGDIKILFPDNVDQFYEIAEGLANAGMNKTIELLENTEDVEKMVLELSKNI